MREAGGTVIYNLHLLRAVAAAMVVGHHLREDLDVAIPGAASVVVGAAGVDIFFVISGVVITLAAHGRTVTPQQFLWHRATRVVTMYWLALGVLAVLLGCGLFPLGVHATDATAVNMLRSMLFVPFERAHGAMMPLLSVGWTLNYEMFFYLVSAGAMVLVPRRWPLGVMLLMLALVGLGLLTAPQRGLAAFYLNPILLEFVGGIALALLWLRWPENSRSGRWAGIALMLLGIALLVWQARQESSAALMPTRVLIFGLPALLCVAGAMLMERSGLRVKSASALLLGSASYALYLSHPFILQASQKLVGTVTHWPATPFAIVLWCGGTFVLAHAIAIALHVRIEQPLTALLRARQRRERPA